MSKKVLLVGGGTGGHIFPLYNLVEALIEQGAETHLLVSDSVLDKKIVQETFTQSPLATHYLKAYKLHYHFSLQNFVNWFKIIKSFWSARKVINQIKPDVIFFKGGFVGFPVLIAAKFLTTFKEKIYLHDSDILPGALSRLFSKYADQTFSNFGEDPHPLFYWPSNNCHPELDSGSKSDFPQILIFGGSQGAQFINELILSNVDKLCEKYRIVLITGPGKTPDRHPGLDPGSSNLEIHEFLDQEKLIEQFFCSSLIIARAGASMFQVLAAQKPMMAIPLPTAARNHQYHNAKYFSDRGLCYLLEQNKDTQKQFLPMIEKISSDQKLSQTLKKFNTNPQAKEITKLILQ